jgi:hypothetical protein
MQIVYKNRRGSGVQSVSDSASAEEALRRHAKRGNEARLITDGGMFVGATLRVPNGWTWWYDPKAFRGF